MLSIIKAIFKVCFNALVIVINYKSKKKGRIMPQIFCNRNKPTTVCFPSSGDHATIINRLIVLISNITFVCTSDDIHDLLPSKMPSSPPPNIDDAADVVNCTQPVTFRIFLSDENIDAKTFLSSPTFSKEYSNKFSFPLKAPQSHVYTLLPDCINYSGKQKPYQNVQVNNKVMVNHPKVIRDSETASSCCLKPSPPQSPLMPIKRQNKAEDLFDQVRRHSRGIIYKY